MPIGVDSSDCITASRATPTIVRQGSSSPSKRMRAPSADALPKWRRANDSLTTATRGDSGTSAAVKARPVGEGEVVALAAAVEDDMRQVPGGEVTSERVGRAVLERLRELDAIAAVRFTSVYKGFDDLADFEHELTLLTKRTAPKRLTGG